MSNTKLCSFEFNNLKLETLNTNFHYFLCKHLYMYSSKMKNDTLALIAILTFSITVWPTLHFSYRHLIQGTYKLHCHKSHIQSCYKLTTLFKNNDERSLKMMCLIQRKYAQWLEKNNVMFSRTSLLRFSYGCALCKIFTF